MEGVSVTKQGGREEEEGEEEGKNKPKRWFLLQFQGRVWYRIVTLEKGVGVGELPREEDSIGRS